MSSRNGILEGRFDNGEHLVETEIAEMLETSRVPVREAFKVPEREGLVEILPFKGAFVTSFAAKDIHEIFTLRCLLEGHAARLAAVLVTEAELSHLSDLHKIIKMAIQENDQQAILQADIDFHREICKLGGNERLLKIYDRCVFF